MLLRTLSLIAVLASVATASQASEIHRVVTALDANNKSTTLADSQVPAGAWVPEPYPGQRIAGLPGGQQPCSYAIAVFASASSPAR